MDEIQGDRAVETQTECPRCVTEGVVTTSGYGTRIICMPDLHPPFRCLASHGGVSHEELVEAGTDPRLLQMWTELARDGGAPGRNTGAEDHGASSDGDASWAQAPLTQDPRLDRSVEAVIQRTQGA